MRHHPLSSKQGTQRSDESRKSLPQWPCLLPSIAVAVAPLRNLTGNPEQQFLVDGFTDRLVTDLFRQLSRFLILLATRRTALEAEPFTAKPLRTQVRGVGQYPAGQFPRNAAGQHSDLGRSDG